MPDSLSPDMMTFLNGVLAQMKGGCGPAEHADLCSAFITKLEDTPHEMVEFNDAVEKMHRREYERFWVEADFSHFEWRQMLAFAEGLRRAGPKPFYDAADRPRFELVGNRARAVLMDEIAFTNPDMEEHNMADPVDLTNFDLSAYYGRTDSLSSRDVQVPEGMNRAARRREAAKIRRADRRS